MSETTEETPLFLDCTQARTRMRGFRFHDLVKLAIGKRLGVRPHPESRRLTFNRSDVEAIGRQAEENPSILGHCRKPLGEWKTHK